MKYPHLAFVLVLLSTILAACGSSSSSAASATPTNAPDVNLTLAAYSTPQDAYKQIVPLFTAQWQEQHHQNVTFKQSFQGSGAQSRAVINGFPADVVALSVAPDVDAIKKAGLITHDWTTLTNKGFVYTSVVALAVRPGNPKGIHDWADLAKPGIQILTPDARTSGGAQWNILALYGAALRGQVTGVAGGDPAAAKTFLTAVLKNVKAFDKDGQTSLTNFENGVGDVAITYESSIIQDKKAGKAEDLVTPTSSILIQNPVAVVDANVDQHGTRTQAEAFVQFLFSAKAQQIFADSGQRVLDPTIAAATAADHPKVADQFTIDDPLLGGWSKVTSQIFGTGGVYPTALAAAQGA